MKQRISLSYFVEYHTADKKQQTIDFVGQVRGLFPVITREAENIKMGEDFL